MSARSATPARARGPSWCWTGRGGGRPARHGAGAGREADAAAGAAPPVPCVRNFGWFSPRAHTQHTRTQHTCSHVTCRHTPHNTAHVCIHNIQHNTHAHIHACTTHNTNTYAHTHVCTHAQLGTAPVHPVPAPGSPHLLSAEAACAEQCGPKEQASTTLVGRGFPWGTCSVRVLARFWGRHGGGLNSAVARG